MVRFDNDYEKLEVRYSFPEFDERVAKAFEAACKQLFEAIKEPILQDYKTLQTAVEEVASSDEFYGKSYKAKDFLLDKEDEPKLYEMEMDLARRFSDFIFDYYKSQCFTRGAMSRIQGLGSDGRDKIEKNLAKRKGYTQFNRAFHKSFLAFEDIVRFDDRSIQKVLREISNYELAVAISRDTSDEVKEAFCNNMSKRARENLEKCLSDLKPVLRSHILECRQKILAVMEELYSCHEINLRKDWI